MMPDMNDLPIAEEPARSPKDLAAIERLRAEIEALRVHKRRLMTHEDEAEYWRSDEAMKHD